MTIGVTIGVEHIGKRVRVVKGYGNFDSAPTGALGVVRAFNPDNLSMVAVELDTRYPSSTTCQGYIPSGRGYWLDATGCLELVDEAPVAKEVAAPSDEEPPPLPTIGPEHIGKRVRVIRQVPGGPPIGTLCVVRLVRGGEVPFVTVEMDALHGVSSRWFRFAPNGYLELFAQGVAHGVAQGVAEPSAADAGLLEPDQYVWAGNDDELSEPLTLNQLVVAIQDYHVVVIYRLTPVARWSLRLEAAATDAEREALQ